MALPTKASTISLADENNGYPTRLDLRGAAAVAVAESYVPADAADWDPAPTTISAALDQLAARVQALEDAP